MEELYKQRHADGNGGQGMSNCMVLVGYKYEERKRRLERQVVADPEYLENYTKALCFIFQVVRGRFQSNRYALGILL